MLVKSKTHIMPSITFRVMVLDAGRVVEFETPDDLLKKQDSIFYGMVKEAGLLPKVSNENKVEGNDLDVDLIDLKANLSDEIDGKNVQK